MVNSCSANGCKNRNTKGGTLTFHRFPLNNKHLLKLWLYQIKRGTWEPSKYSVICSEHFTEDSFVIKGQNNRRTLKNDACPTVFSVKNYTEPPKKKKNPRERSVVDVEMKEVEEEDKSEKNDEGDKSEKNDEGDKFEKIDGDKSEKNDEGDKSEKNDEGDKSEKNDEGDKSEKNDEGEKSEKNDGEENGENDESSTSKSEEKAPVMDQDDEKESN